MNTDEIVRKARSLFSAGQRADAWTLIQTEATHQQQAGDKAASNELYLGAIQQISVDLAQLLVQQGHSPEDRLKAEEEVLGKEPSASADQAELPGEIPNITELDLSRRGVRDKHMRFLCELRTLTRLDLGFNEITNAGMTHLVALKLLVNLNLRNNTEISDNGVKNLAQLTSLSVLDLRDTRLSDQGLNYLLGLKSLTRLLAARTSVTAEGANNFRHNHPNLNLIVHL